MIKAYIDFWKRAFDFKGRSSRPDYWWAFLVNVLITLVFTIAFVWVPLAVAINASGISITNDSQAFMVLVSSYMWPTWIPTLILFIPQLSLQVRRLRDAGFHPGWAVLNYIGWIPLIRIFSFIGTIALFIMSCMPTKR